MAENELLSALARFRRWHWWWRAVAWLVHPPAPVAGWAASPTAGAGDGGRATMCHIGRVAPCGDAQAGRQPVVRIVRPIPPSAGHRGVGSRGHPVPVTGRPRMSRGVRTSGKAASARSRPHGSDCRPGRRAASDTPAGAGLAQLLGLRLGRLDDERLRLDLTLIDDEKRVAPGDTRPPPASGLRTIGPSACGA
jgi:hypothetical protein